MISDEIVLSEAELVRIVVRLAWRSFADKLQDGVIDKPVLKIILRMDVLAAGAGIPWLSYHQALFLALVAQILWESEAGNPHLKFPAPSTGDSPRGA